MTAPNNLELQGSFQRSPLAELLVELRQTQLDGSLRLQRETNKTVIYFKYGEIVFAVSNARSARIFEMLLRAGKIDKQILAEHPCYANDLEFAKILREKNLFSEAEIERLFSAQIENILRDALDWQNGEWTFSPLVKIRDGIRIPVSLPGILVEYARRLSGEEVFRRFRSVKENFTVCGTLNASSALQPHEAFVLSRFADSELTVDQALQTSALPETPTLQTLYALWLGGFLIRRNWNSVFTEHRVNTILSARLARKKEAVEFQPAPKPVETAPVARTQKETLGRIETPGEAPKETQAEVKKEVTLEEYLARIEATDNYYDILAVEAKSAVADIKLSYFNLAKQFHPDRFYKKTDDAQHKRIQNAFSKIAQAYETLKHEDSRRTYDFKIRKELAQKEKTASASVAEVSEQKQTDMATENFEIGFSHLMDENYDEALPFLARAVHLAPNVARFHAYYGKALAADETQRFKAESEMQTAIKLDGENATFRFLLAEFFVQYNLLKRAEGELNRLLDIFPHNRDARVLLDSLRNK
jgi:curved DNA-binding protein CbpA